MAWGIGWSCRRNPVPHVSLRERNCAMKEIVLSQRNRWVRIVAWAVVSAAALFSQTRGFAAATNDIAGALQKGLLAEEGNHDLAAAIQEYQAVLDDFSRLHQVAATAAFRLAECYRKQGNTNAANAAYRRVISEFSDQTQLATLSRKYLPVAEQPPIAGEGGQISTEISSESSEVQRIQAMIKDSPDLINARDSSNGDTPLHKAAEKDQLVVAKFLLENGADVNAKNTSFGVTPLHAAASRGSTAMLDLLLEHKADVEASDTSGLTALHLAAQSGFRTAVETLLAHGANVNAKTQSGATALHFAVANGFTAISEVLLAHGADPNMLAQNVQLGHEVGSGSPLHVSAARNDPGLTLLLLTNRATVDLKNNQGMTPLLLAAQKGSVAAAEVLLQHGANPNARVEGYNPGHEGWTPLFFAIDGNQQKMVELLLKNKADPNLSCDLPAWGGDWTALTVAARKGYSNLIEPLLSGGADPNLKSQNGRFPLVEAAASADLAKGVPIAKLLLDHGADVNEKDNGNTTALIAAAYRRAQPLIDLLFKHQVDVNAHDLAGRSALHSLVNSLNSSFSPSLGGPPEDAVVIAEMLLGGGADVNAQDKEGQTPLSLAQRNSMAPGMAKLIDVLKSHGALAELPDYTSIRVTRSGLNTSFVVFRADTNGFNHFSALETIGYFYISGPGAPFAPPGIPLPLRFPDFSRARILRPVPDHPSERKTIPLALLDSSDAFDYTKDVKLEFGDLLEIPEREHPLSEAPVGLTSQQQAVLKACLMRKVTLVVKGQSLTLDVEGPTPTGYAGATPNAYLSKALGLPKFQGLLRSSSDLSRVTVKRSASKFSSAGEFHEDVLRFWNNKDQVSNDLWLREGDVIEVPDKP